MRVQLQESRSGVTLHTEGIPIEGDPNRGVTVRQVQAALGELFSRARGLNWFKNTYMRDLRRAIINTSQELNRYPPLGISRIGNMREVSHEFPGPNRSMYRVDVDNLRGTNLRE
jgi:hypothetical protein